jgi:SPP1 gp7 family putative phage head morphogenesis protein
VAGKALGTLIREVYADGAKAYREAIAEQILQQRADEEWDRWQEDTAALLLIAWAAGAHGTMYLAGVKVPKPAVPTRFAAGEAEEDVALRFDAGPAREAVSRFVDLLPITRQRWDQLIDLAFRAAKEMRDAEAANGLARILERSPALARLVRPAAAGLPVRPVPGLTGKALQEWTEKVRTPGVQAIAQGAFFVTGMTVEQAKKTQDLLAKVVRMEESVSAAGKKLRSIGVGDFIEQATLATGTNLTKARLETVYRTNLNRAASQGQLDIVREPTVRKFVPLMQFSSTKDNRTRETHKAMNGYVATVDQIDAQGINTPAGFNCRCGWKPLPIAVALAKGWCDEDGIPKFDAIARHNGRRQALIDGGQFPDPGFVSG